MCIHRLPHRAFSLIELLVSLVIITTLLTLLLPAAQRTREAARHSSCKNNLKQIGLALHNYHDTYNTFPPGGFAELNNNHSYLVFLLPYVEYGSLFDKFDFNVRSSVPPNINNATTIPKIYQCPSATITKHNDAFTTHYYGNMGSKDSSTWTATYKGTIPTGKNQGGFGMQGILGASSSVRIRNVTDGTSHTFMIGESSADSYKTGTTAYREWTRGCATDNACANSKNVFNGINGAGYNSYNNFNDVSFSSPHDGGCHLLFTDGSVHFASEKVDLGVYRATASRNGGEPKTLDTLEF